MPTTEEKLLFKSIVSYAFNPAIDKTTADNKVLADVAKQVVLYNFGGGIVGSISMYFISTKVLLPKQRVFGVIAGIIGYYIGSSITSNTFQPIKKGIGEMLQLQSPIGDYARQSAVEILPQSHPLRDFNKYSVNNNTIGMEIENDYRENEMLKESQYDSYSYNNNQHKSLYNTNNNNNKAYEINNNYNNNNYTKEPEYQYQKSRYSLENERYNNNINKSK